MSKVNKLALSNWIIEKANRGYKYAVAWLSSGVPQMAFTRTYEEAMRVTTERPNEIVDISSLIGVSYETR